MWKPYLKQVKTQLFGHTLKLTPVYHVYHRKYVTMIQGNIFSEADRAVQIRWAQIVDKRAQLELRHNKDKNRSFIQDVALTLWLALLR